MSTKDTSTRLGDIGPYTLGLDTCRSLECKGPKGQRHEDLKAEDS
jgi:hypothetical protein